MFDEILSNELPRLFFVRDDTGKIEIVFDSSIEKIEPGDTQLTGFEWTPTLDRDGNTRVDDKGNPRKPWSTFQVHAHVTDAVNPKDIGVKIYSFGGEFSSQLREFVKVMKARGISNQNLKGTKWSIELIGKNDWSIQYLGKDKDTKQSKEPKKEVKEDTEEIKKIKEALSVKKGQHSDLTKHDISSYLSFLLGKPTEECEKMIPDLVDRGIIKVDGDNVEIL